MILDKVLEDKLVAILDKKLDAKFDPILKSLEFISNGFDELTQKISNLEQSNEILAKENQFLKNQLAELWKEVNDVKVVMDEQEQYFRRESLEIRGIPTTLKENTDEIVKSIGSLLDVKIEEQDISVSHRMPLSINKPNAAPPGSSRSSRDMPVIVVKFTNRNVRDRLYRVRSNLKNFTVGDIGLGRFGDGKIFIQESLTARRRKLFKQCLEIRKKFNYKLHCAGRGEGMGPWPPCEDF